MILDIAGCHIYMENIYPYSEDFCKEYIVQNTKNVISACPEYDFEGIITQEDIDYERAKSEQAMHLHGKESPAFSDAYLETLAIYRKLAEWFPLQKTILMHASVVAVDGRGYLFSARSGTGKSTHTRLWMQYFGEHAAMINDDKPLLKIQNGIVTAYGTPWDGKHRLSTNTSVPLAGICFLHRAFNNEIERIDAAKAYPMMLQQTYRPHNRESMCSTLVLLDELLSFIPVYLLHCNMEISAVKTAYEGMNK